MPVIAYRLHLILGIQLDMSFGELRQQSYQTFHTLDRLIADIAHFGLPVSEIHLAQIRGSTDCIADLWTFDHTVAGAAFEVQIASKRVNQSLAGWFSGMRQSMSELYSALSDGWGPESEDEKPTPLSADTKTAVFAHIEELKVLTRKYPSTRRADNDADVLKQFRETVEKITALTKGRAVLQNAGVGVVHAVLAHTRQRDGELSPIYVGVDELEVAWLNELDDIDDGRII